jgi:hypothetical protein
MVAEQILSGYVVWARSVALTKGHDMRRITVERFIKTYMKVYNQGGNQSMVAKCLKCSPENVCIRLKHLRDIGVDLPKMKRKKHYDANYLNKIVANCG